MQDIKSGNVLLGRNYGAKIGGASPPDSRSAIPFDFCDGGPKPRSEHHAASGSNPSHLSCDHLNIIHGVLSPATDVGMAQFQRRAGGNLTQNQQGMGTFAWSAPEVLMGERCTEKVGHCDPINGTDLIPSI